VHTIKVDTDELSRTATMFSNSLLKFAVFEEEKHRICSMSLLHAVLENSTKSIVA